MRNLSPFMQAVLKHIEYHGNQTVTHQDCHKAYNVGFYHVRLHDPSASLKPDSVTVKGGIPEISLQLGPDRSVTVVQAADLFARGETMSDADFLGRVPDPKLQNFWRELLNVAYGLPAVAEA